MLKQIVTELKIHSPFTLFGALTGIILMMIMRNIPHEAAHTLFYVFHPLHILLSAIVTTAMYVKYSKSENQNKVIRAVKILAIGFIGSVGIGTLSDSLIPYWGETLLEMPHRHAHIGFIDKWWLINPMAVAGILFACWKPTTKLPHASHVLLSTWASLFHMLMASQIGGDPAIYFAVFVFLFLAVWAPCCLSDIVFPLLFIKDKEHPHDCFFCSSHKH